MPHPKNVEDREARKVTFNEIAELYDRARPSYPDIIFDDLFSITNLGLGADVLEIGCGTGQASVSLATRKANLTCVELGENMAQLARLNLAHCETAKVVVSTFEDWDPAGQEFDIVFASSAWHWLDHAVAYPKVISILKDTGALAILSNNHAYPSGYDPLFDEIQKCYVRHMGSTKTWPPEPPEALPDKREEIEQAGVFGQIEVRRYMWSREYRAKEYVEMLATYSDHIMMEPASRAALEAEIERLIRQRPGQTVRKDYQSILHVAWRA